MTELEAYEATLLGEIARMAGIPPAFMNLRWRDGRSNTEVRETILGLTNARPGTDFWAKQYLALLDSEAAGT